MFAEGAAKGSGVFAWPRSLGTSPASPDVRQALLNCDRRAFFFFFNCCDFLKRRFVT